MKLTKLQDLPVKGKRVLLRVDYNVPLKEGKVVEDTRIRETLPTIEKLLKEGCRVAIISHLGRPKGKPEAKYSLAPVAASLSKMLKKDVPFAKDCVGPDAEKVVNSLKPGQAALLENLRFHSEEEKNDPAFSKKLSSLGDVFVQDAFGALHRAHASTAGVPKLLPGGIGFLVQRELEFLDRLVNNPARPFLAIIGGAKVSDKLGVLKRLLERVDTLFVGGGMSFTFLAAQGMEIGNSLVEKNMIDEAQKIIEAAFQRNVSLLLPADHIAAKELKPKAATQETQGMAVPEGWMGLDIGPRSIEILREQISLAKTIFWNGPLGVFETPPFDRGTVDIAKAVGEATENGAVTIAGGGDTLAALAVAKVDNVTHRSTGGGASLELLEGKVLPGLAALSKG
jgi:phosphoglycerate kinase